MTKIQQIERDIRILSERTGLDLTYTAQGMGSGTGYRLECNGREIGARMTIGQFALAVDMCEQLMYMVNK